MIVENITRHDVASNRRLVRLTELAVQDGIRDGPFGSSLKTAHYSREGARVIRLQNVGSMQFLNHDKAFIPHEHYRSLQRYSVVSGDLIVAALGEGSRPAGRACLLPDGIGDAIVKADCFRVRLSPDKAIPEFVCYYLNSEYSLSRVALSMRGATRPRVTLAMLKDWQIPTPPLAEQEDIVQRVRNELAAFERARIAVEVQSRAIGALSGSILRRAFQGVA